MHQFQGSWLISLFRVMIITIIYIILLSLNNTILCDIIVWNPCMHASQTNNVVATVIIKPMSPLDGYAHTTFNAPLVII